MFTGSLTHLFSCLLRPPCNGSNRPDRPPLAVDAVDRRTGTDGIGGVIGGNGIAGWRAGIAFYREAVLPVPAIHEAHMGDALEVRIIDAEHVACAWRGVRSRWDSDGRRVGEGGGRRGRFRWWPCPKKK